MCAEDEKMIYIDVHGVRRFNRRTGLMVQLIFWRRSCYLQSVQRY